MRAVLPVLVLGCGYTGRRVAAALLAQGREVHATTRRPEGLADLAARGLRVHVLDVTEPPLLRALGEALPPDLVALHSVPVLAGCGGPREVTADLLEALGPRVRRMVYLSSTGVYGATTEVDASTPAAPETALQRLRLAAEAAVAARIPSALVLRSAAIYGPGRGIHVRLREGRDRLAGHGTDVVSRIHVDDLATLAVTGLDASLEGAWPVADEEPARACDVAAFCAAFLGIPVPPPEAPPAGSAPRPRTTRRVDGSGIVRALRVPLRHPSWRTGIPAAIAAE